MSEPPSPDGRKSRSDAAARLAALFSDVDPTAPAPSDLAPAGGVGHERMPDDDGALTVVHDLRSLDRLLGGGDGVVDPPRAVPAAVPAVPRPQAAVPSVGEGDAAEDHPDPAPPPMPVVDPEPSAQPEGIPEILGKVFDEPEDAVGGEGTEGPILVPGSEGPAPRRRITLRAVAFGTAFALLLAAIPVLGFIGVRRLADSHAGTLQGGSRQPDETGYLAIVAPTRTALIVHRDDTGGLASATLLALGAGEEVGGTVLQIPLTTQVRDGAFLVTMVGQAFEGNDIENFQREVEDRLNLAVDERVELSDGQIAELVRPVAPLRLDNPDDVMLPDGSTVAAGSVELAPEEVGPFLRAGEDTEAELARLARDEVVWTAWLTALGAADEGASAVSTSLRPFLEALAAGTRDGAAATRVETLDVGPADDGSEALVPGEGFDDQVNAAVPFPQSPGPGRRYTLKLLNGVEGAPLPREITRDLVAVGASVVQVGNGNEFDQETTQIEITGPDWRPAADAALFMFGGKGKISVMSDTRAAGSDVDVVITVGRDVLATYEERAGG